MWLVITNVGHYKSKFKTLSLFPLLSPSCLLPWDDAASIKAEADAGTMLLNFLGQNKSQ